MQSRWRKTPCCQWHPRFWPVNCHITILLTEQPLLWGLVEVSTCSAKVLSELRARQPLHSSWLTSFVSSHLLCLIVVACSLSLRCAVSTATIAAAAQQVLPVVLRIPWHVGPYGTVNLKCSAVRGWSLHVWGPGRKAHYCYRGTTSHLSVQHRVGAPRTPSPLSSQPPHHAWHHGVLCVRAPVAQCTLNVIIQLNSRDLSKQGQQ